MTDRSAIQLIDEEKEFHQSALQYFQQCIGNRDVGLDYHVISVFGSQSQSRNVENIIGTIKNSSKYITIQNTNQIFLIIFSNLFITSCSLR